MFENGDFTGNGGNLVTELRAKADEAAEIYRQAKARRQAYWDSIRPQREAPQNFKMNLWEHLFPKRDDDDGESVEPPYLRERLEQFDLGNLRGIHQAGAYEELDRLNAEVAPFMEIFRVKKQAENLAKTNWDKVLRDLDQAVRRAALKKARALPLFADNERKSA